MTEMSNYSKINFIRNVINKDIKHNNAKVVTRFSPEPNGYLHIGHAKSICLNFGIAKEYRRGPCHLRFDDTNPVNEEIEFFRAIQEDITWLGFDWGNHLYCSSDYFNHFYKLAIFLIEKNLAYVCHLSPEKMKTFRGTLSKKGKNSPYRNRSINENLNLFKKMNTMMFDEGECTLRAKIDMSSSNLNLRDPVLYRIKNPPHSYTEKRWLIYPMYDFAHAASDAIEKITHSLCTLEFQEHRPLYNWIIDKCGFDHKPQQIEFSRLNINYTITSKRKLKYLVEKKLVNGWDDPRMPTLRGLRRRGVTANSIRNLCDLVGISKQDSIINMSLFEQVIRNDLNQRVPRRNAVLTPLEVHIDNLTSQFINVPNHPQDDAFGRRDITISDKIYIEEGDFMEMPKSGYRKLSLMGRARLLNAYIIECYQVIKNNEGRPILLKCRYFPETMGGKRPVDGKLPEAVLHWVDAKNSMNAEIRIYDRLFSYKNPTQLSYFEEGLNPNSLNIIHHAKLEKSLENTPPESHFQFNRLGYFCTDQHDHNQHNPVFNKTIGLRDTWKKSK